MRRRSALELPARLLTRNRGRIWIDDRAGNDAVQGAVAASEDPLERCSIRQLPDHSYREHLRWALWIVCSEIPIVFGARIVMILVECGLSRIVLAS